MSKVKVSVCVVTYNNKDEIINLIDSVFNNTKGVSFKFYLVDNNSSDGTANFIEERYKEKIEIIKNKDNKGFGYAHNKVLDLIDSDYHIIINPDISFDKDVISDLCKFMDENPDVGVVTPKVLYENGDQQHLPKKDPKFKYILAGKLERIFKSFSKIRKEYTMADINIDRPIEIEFCTGCFMMIRTDLFKKLKGFDDKFFMYLEDADLSRRAREYGKVIFTPNVCVNHLWHRASSKKLKFLFIHISSMIKYFKKWH